MFKIIIGVVAALAISGVAYGAADILAITNLPVAQQGDAESVVCDDSGVQLYINESGGLPDSIVESVTVAGIDTGCEGAGIRVTLTDDGNWAAEVNSTISNADVDPGNFVADFSGAGILFKDLTDVHVQFSGGVPLP